MTSPGGQTEIDPGRMYNIAGSMDGRAGEFNPDAPAAAGQWPSQQATQQYNDAVAAINTFAAQHHMSKAEALRLYTFVMQTVDEKNQGLIGGVGGKSGVAQGLDLAGAGSIINGVFAPLGQAFSGLSQALFNPVGQVVGAGGTIAGQLGGQLTALSKSATDQLAKDGHVGVTAGAGGSGGGNGAAATEPAGAAGPPPPMGTMTGSSAGASGRAGARGDNAYPQDDRDRVVPAGAPMPLASGMGGLGAMGGTTSSSGGKPATYKVVAPGGPLPEPDDPPTAPLPIPVAAEPRSTT